MEGVWGGKSWRGGPFPIAGEECKYRYSVKKRMKGGWQTGRILWGEGGKEMGGEKVLRVIGDRFCEGWVRGKFK